jgi:hypothetical protein
VQKVLSSFKIVLVAAAKRGGLEVDVCGGCELMWSGGVVAQDWSKTKNNTTAAIYADHFGVSRQVFF